jgi:branched-chain amino acid transport system substrate-binding protein
MFPFTAMADSHVVNGISNNSILLGMSNALTGPASVLGSELKKGSQVYFEQINQQGGIHHRKIKLLSYDDGYEPERAYKNTQKLIYTDKVFALFGYVGTPTSKAVMPIINKEQELYFAPFTGADFLRSPVVPTIFNVRGSYYAEVDTQVEYFIKQQKYSQVGLFIQADDFGLAVTRGITKSLQQEHIFPIVNTRFKRNTNQVTSAVNALLRKNPQVIFCVGTYQPIAKLINQMRSKGYQGKFVTVSFVGAYALAQRLNNLQGVYVSSVVPSPRSSLLAIVVEYQQAMIKAGFSDFNHESLEGYINAKVFVEIAKRCGAALNKECFIKQANQLDIDIGGLQVRYNKNNHQGMKVIYLQDLALDLNVKH